MKNLYFKSCVSLSEFYVFLDAALARLHTTCKYAQFVDDAYFYLLQKYCLSNSKSKT